MSPTASAGSTPDRYDSGTSSPMRVSTRRAAVSPSWLTAHACNRSFHDVVRSSTSADTWSRLGSAPSVRVTVNVMRARLLEPRNESISVAIDPYCSPTSSATCSGRRAWKR